MNKERLISTVNEVRERNDLSALTFNDKLSQSAQYRAEELCTTGNWSHDGWVKSLTYNYTVAGENLAKNYKNEELTVQAWVDSPLHYENIIGDYKETGMGVKSCGENTYIVQHFGSPMPPAPDSHIEYDFIMPLLVSITLCVAFLVAKWVLTHKNKTSTL